MRLWSTVPLLLATLFCSLAFSQSTAEVRGKVVDGQGHPIVSAFVVIVGQDTALMRGATTDATGDFHFSALPVSSYSLQISADGFNTYASSAFTASIGQAVSFNIVLGSGDVASHEEKHRESAMVETSKSQLGVVMGSQEITALPLKSRDTYDLLQLQPGVQSTLGADLFYGGDRPGVVSVNGGRPRSNNYQVNGGHAGDQLVNMPSIQPSPDSVREFRVITHNYAAELGRNSGSVLNVITRAGANQLHGSVFEFLRNDVVNAKGYFDPEKAAFNQNEFGAAFGAPLRRDRTFLYASYEGRRLRRGITSDPVSLPSAQERAGDFSSGTPFAGVLVDRQVAEVLNARSDCAAAVAANGGDPIAAETPYSAIFPGNVIPQECFDRTAVAVLQNYVPSDQENFRASPISRERRDQVTLRADHNLTSQQQANFYYYGSDGYLSQPFARFQGSGANLPGFGDVTRERFQQANLSHIWTINAKTNNEIRLVYYRQGQGKLGSPLATNSVFESCPGLSPDECFADPEFPGLGIRPGFGARIEGVPFITLAGGFTVGNNRNGSFSQTGNVYQLIETYAKNIGKHSVTFGADVRNQRLNQGYFYNVNGALELTGGGSNDVIYDDLTPNFLLGLVDGFSQGSFNKVDVRTTQLHLFGQDEWKVRPNLSLSYGLRWELNTPQADAGKRIQAFRPGQATTAFGCTLTPDDPLTALVGSNDCSLNGSAGSVFPLGLVFPGDAGIPDGLTETYYRSYAPRVGLAWSPNWSSGVLSKLSGGPGKSSVRAGWGIFYDSNEELLMASFVGQPPFGRSTYLSNVFLSSPFLAQDGTQNPNLISGVLNPERGSAVDFALFRPIQLFGNYPDRLPSQYSEHYHVTLQRELAKDTMLQLGYVGSQGHRLLATLDQNYGSARTCLELNQIPGMSCGPYDADSSFTIPAGTIPEGVTLHLPYGSVPVVTGPNTDAVTLVGLRRYSSPLCEPTTGVGCPPDGIPVFGSVFATLPVASSSYNSFQALLRTSRRGLNLLASYTWSKSLDNASSFEQSVNPIDPSLSRSLSLFDARHRFVGSFLWQAPRWNRNRWTSGVTSGWSLSGITTWQSGFPIRITSTSDQELNGSYSYEAPGGPDLVAPFRRLDPHTSGGYYFDPASFAEATLGTYGSSPRTLCCGPGIANVDLAVIKGVRMTEQSRIEFRTELFNIFNHTQFFNPDGNITNGDAFGTVTRARDPRLIQFGLRLTF